MGCRTMSEKCNQEVCNLRFDELEKRVSKMEDYNEKKAEEMSVISKAIVAIQTANEYTAKTLERIEQKLEEKVEKVSFFATESGKNVLKYGVILAIGIGALLVGTHFIDTIEALKSLQIK